jgi:hypothetical protein
MATPTVSPVQIAYPAMNDPHLRLRVGACRLTITPGAGDAWATGTYRDPSGHMPLRVTQEVDGVRLDHLHDVSDFIGLLSGTPTLEIALGTARPYRLTIEAAASQNTVELGGVPLTRFVMKHGAGAGTLAFSTPNPVAMTLLQVSAGAASLDARQLANANASLMTFDGGAAAYTFDFGGALQRDTFVRIATGISSVTIAVPEVTPARIRLESLLNHLDVGDGFTRHEGAFCTSATLAGVTPLLSIDTDIALGLLQLRLSSSAPTPGATHDSAFAREDPAAAIWEGKPR